MSFDKFFDLTDSWSVVSFFIILRNITLVDFIFGIIIASCVNLRHAAVFYSEIQGVFLRIRGQYYSMRSIEDMPNFRIPS